MSILDFINTGCSISSDQVATSFDKGHLISVRSFVPKSKVEFVIAVQVKNQTTLGNKHFFIFNDSTGSSQIYLRSVYQGSTSTSNFIISKDYLTGASVNYNTSGPTITTGKTYFRVIWTKEKIQLYGSSTGSSWTLYSERALGFDFTDEPLSIQIGDNYQIEDTNVFSIYLDESYLSIDDKTYTFGIIESGSITIDRGYYNADGTNIIKFASPITKTLTEAAVDLSHKNDIILTLDSEGTSSFVLNGSDKTLTGYKKTRKLDSTSIYVDPSKQYILGTEPTGINASVVSYSAGANGSVSLTKGWIYSDGFTYQNKNTDALSVDTLKGNTTGIVGYKNKLQLGNESSSDVSVPSISEGLTLYAYDMNTDIYLDNTKSKILGTTATSESWGEGTTPYTITEGTSATDTGSITYKAGYKYIDETNGSLFIQNETTKTLDQLVVGDKAEQMGLYLVIKTDLSTDFVLSTTEPTTDTSYAEKVVDVYLDRTLSYIYGTTADPRKQLTINATPATASIHMVDSDGEAEVTGTGTASILVPAGHQVTWGVSLAGYTSQSGEETVTEDTTKQITLSPDTSTSLRIIGDDVTINNGIATGFSTTSYLEGDFE